MEDDVWKLILIFSIVASLTVGFAEFLLPKVNMESFTLSSLVTIGGNMLLFGVAAYAGFALFLFFVLTNQIELKKLISF